jgi:hypothetical protein
MKRNNELLETTTPAPVVRPAKAEAEPITCTIQEAAKLTGLCVGSIWNLISDRKLETRKVDGVRRTLIIYASLKKLLQVDEAA